jgi:hypothetical protein
MTRMYGAKAFEWLIGKTVVSVTINEKKTAICFNTLEAGSIRFVTKGDCCSSTWIEHIDNLDALIAHRIVATEEIDMGPSKWFKTDWNTGEETETTNGFSSDCVRFYGQSFTTDLGIFKVEYRNRSNGYYGGSLNHDGYHLGDANIQVTEDF